MALVAVAPEHSTPKLGSFRSSRDGQLTLPSIKVMDFFQWQSAQNAAAQARQEGSSSGQSQSEQQRNASSSSSNPSINPPQPLHAVPSTSYQNLLQQAAQAQAKPAWGSGPNPVAAYLQYMKQQASRPQDSQQHSAPPQQNVMHISHEPRSSQGNYDPAHTGGYSYYFQDTTPPANQTSFSAFSGLGSSTTSATSGSSFDFASAASPNTSGNPRPQASLQDIASSSLFQDTSANPSAPFSISPSDRSQTVRSMSPEETASWQQRESSNASHHRVESSGDFSFKFEPPSEQQHASIASMLIPQSSFNSGSFSSDTGSDANTSISDSSNFSAAATPQTYLQSLARPNLSLFTDPNTLQGGWSPSASSSGTPQLFHSALQRPELIFSADPSAYTPSGPSMLQHPQGASRESDLLNQSESLFDHRSTLSPAESSPISRIPSPNPFAFQGSPTNSPTMLTAPFYSPSNHPSSQPFSPSQSRPQALQRESSSGALLSPATSSRQRSTGHRKSSSSSLLLPQSSLSGRPLSPSSIQRDDGILPSLNTFHIRSPSDPSPSLQQKALDSWSRLPNRPESEEDVHRILKPHIYEYLNTSNKLLLGERTIVVMSTSVGQKSYGKERRFLVPPPTAFILGSSWWIHLPDSYMPALRQPSPYQGTQLFPPALHVTMEPQGVVSETSLEWTTFSGENVDKIASADDFVVAGRVLGKQLYISDTMAKEGKDKASVEAAFRLVSPGFGREIDRTIGTFLSKPIKIISKPSKKVQNNKKGNVYVTHGGTVALFNRLRSQTVSTRFLCVSSAAANFPAWDWHSMTGQDHKPFAGEQSSVFTARTTAWDSFVIYAVDPHRRAVDLENAELQEPPQIGFPHPPAHVLPLARDGTAMPIYYNQPVILQCLNTAVVSPIMIIRKVEKGNSAIGGGSADGATAKPKYDLPAGPGERLGDPVSQLHRIALEVMPDASTAYHDPVSPTTGFTGGSSYLSCLGDNVGIRKSEGDRVPFVPEQSSPKMSGTPAGERGDPFDILAQKNLAVSGSRGSVSSFEGTNELPLPVTNHGGKVPRSRSRSSASMSSPIQPPVKGKRRLSISVSPNQSDPGETASTEGIWTQDAGEAGCWTIASTEIARHTFYIPPVLFSGLTPRSCSATGAPHTFLTPIPSTPLGVLPIVKKYIPSGGDAKPCITLYGEHLSDDWTVWFGDIPSPNRSPSACSEVLECVVPDDESIDPLTKRHLLLVRYDGVIVPTHVYWTPS